MKFLLKFPSRGRPDKFKKTLSNHLEYLSHKNDYKFIFTFDEDDESMNNFEIKNFIEKLKINYEIFYGESKNKIEAINANLENQEFDVLILIPDDMIPCLNDYDEYIREIFEKSENGLDTILHFNTSTWADLLDVWCIMGKTYYDRFGYIYYPEYKSICADNEYTEVAKILNKYIFSELCPFNHYFESDETAVKNWYFNAEDDVVYQIRKKINFGIDKL